MRIATGDVVTGFDTRKTTIRIGDKVIVCKPNSVAFEEGGNWESLAHQPIGGGLLIDHAASPDEIHTGKTHERTQGLGTIVPVMTHDGMIEVKVTKRYWRSCSTRDLAWVEESDNPTTFFSVVGGKLHATPRATFDG